MIIFLYTCIKKGASFVKYNIHKYLPFNADLFYVVLTKLLLDLPLLLTKYVILTET